jgi:Zn finger protein HypA/HybF involved in hydrogenase expression
MKIKTIVSQHRRDFVATFECEHCEHIEENVTGYDDDNFHENVIPNWECPKCKKKAADTYRPLKTKYPADYVI